MSHLLLKGAFASFFVLLLATTIEAMEQNKQPNFVFIAIDDLNDWVGYMDGHPQAKTPNMDSLANQGVAFTNAHSVAPGCSPSRNALLEGVEPFNSGLYPFYEHEIHKDLKQKYTSLPTLLKNNGYQTFGAGKIHHGPEYSAAEWSDYLKPQHFAKTYAVGKGFHSNKKASYRPTTNPYHQMLDHQVTSYGINVVGKKHEQPFFVAIGLEKPHLPFDCPVEFYDALPDKILPPKIVDNDLDDIGPEGNSMRRAREDKRFSDNGRWQDVRRAYLACAHWVDYNVGHIMDAVKKGPNKDNTVVVLWSDHGYHLGEKKTFKKFTLWEEASRVPFIIYDTREPETFGREVKQGVTLINIYKTIAEFAGIETPDYVDGFSLVPYMTNPALPVEKPAIMSWGQGNYSVRTQDWRLIQYFDGTQELYHNQEDQNEWHNLAGQPEYKKKLVELTALLPKQEAPTVEKYLAGWSIFGADKARLRAVAQQQKNAKSQSEKPQEK